MIWSLAPEKNTRLIRLLKLQSIMASVDMCHAPYSEPFLIPKFFFHPYRSMTLTNRVMQSDLSASSFFSFLFLLLPPNGWYGRQKDARRGYLFLTGHERVEQIAPHTKKKPTSSFLFDRVTWDVVK